MQERHPEETARVERENRPRELRPGVPPQPQEVEALEEKPVGGEDRLAHERVEAGAGREPGAEAQGIRGVGGDEPPHREGHPCEALGHEDEGAHERQRGGQGKPGQRAEDQRDEPDAVGQAGDDLPAIRQRVTDEAGGDCDQQQHPAQGVVDHARCFEAVRGVGGEIQRRPSAPDQAAAEDHIAGAPLQDDPAGQHRHADTDADGDPPQGAEVGERVAEEQADPDDEDEDADLVRPAPADDSLPLVTAQLRAEPLAQPGEERRSRGTERGEFRLFGRLRRSVRGRDDRSWRERRAAPKRLGHSGINPDGPRRLGADRGLGGCQRFPSRIPEDLLEARHSNEQVPDDGFGVALRLLLRRQLLDPAAELRHTPDQEPQHQEDDKAGQGVHQAVTKCLARFELGWLGGRQNLRCGPMSATCHGLERAGHPSDELARPARRLDLNARRGGLGSRRAFGPSGAPRVRAGVRAEEPRGLQAPLRQSVTCSEWRRLYVVPGGASMRRRQRRRREPRACAGELLQLDGSDHEWLAAVRDSARPCSP